jgi:hypothetical protein
VLIVVSWIIDPASLDLLESRIGERNERIERFKMRPNDRASPRCTSFSKSRRKVEKELVQARDRSANLQKQILGGTIRSFLVNDYAEHRGC